jgi:hypothetical protein
MSQLVVCLIVAGETYDLCTALWRSEPIEEQALDFKHYPGFLNRIFQKPSPTEF